MTPWVVINPRAGDVRGEPLARRIRAALGARPAMITSELPPSSAPRRRLVIAAGGDGTVNRILNHCDPATLRLALLPCGSANDLAGELGVPSTFEAAWAVLEEAHFESIDLLRVNGSLFATCGGFGFASAVARRANTWKAGVLRPLTRILGSLVYPVATLAEIAAAFPRPVRARIRARGATRFADLSTAIVSNQQRFGRRFTASRAACNADGELDLCGVGVPRSRARLLRLCAQFARGGPAEAPEVFRARARSMTIETDRVVSFFGDGEPLARGRRFALDVLPRALVVARPARQVCTVELRDAG